MENKSEKENLSSSGAHSRFRRGLSDYSDDGHLTHYLGNDDYDGTNEPKEDDTENVKLDGREAAGNELTEEDVKAHRQAEIDEKLTLHRDE